MPKDIMITKQYFENIGSVLLSLWSNYPFSKYIEYCSTVWYPQTIFKSRFHLLVVQRASHFSVISALDIVQTFNSCTSRPDVCQCLVVQTPTDSMSKTTCTSSISMTHVACESKLRSIVRSSVHPRLRNSVAIMSAVVYYVRAARSFSAGIKFRHCSLKSVANSGENLSNREKQRSNSNSFGTFCTCLGPYITPGCGESSE